MELILKRLQGQGRGASGEEMELYPMRVNYLFIAQAFRASCMVTTLKLFLDMVPSSLADNFTTCVAWIFS